jgi:hypothetical protein
MTIAFYPVANGTTVETDGYFEIPGNFTPMFVPGFQFVATDSGSSPKGATAVTFYTVSSMHVDGSTRIIPSLGGSPLTAVGSPANLTPNGSWVSIIGGAYTLDFSDSNITPITVYVAELNTDTSLVFPGRATLNYGEIILENFLHILESFASYTAPINPITGQLWFDKGTLSLKIWNDDSPGGWVNVLSGLALDDFADVEYMGSPAPSVDDVLTWDGSKWTNSRGVNYHEYIASGGETNISTGSVNVLASQGPGKSYQQVLLNGIMLREGMGGSPPDGGYYVSGANQITINPPYAPLTALNEIMVYQT